MNTGTRTASYQFSGFSAGANVAIAAWFDGTPLDLDPATAATTYSFAWSASDGNHVALSTRATGYVQMDNFAVRKLPVSAVLSVEHAFDSGLDGAQSGPDANPDGDRLDNYAEWAFGTNPAESDDVVSATLQVIVQPLSSTFRFAHRQRSDIQAYGVGYVYQVSGDLDNWRPVAPIEESVSPLPATPAYEAVTMRLPDEVVSGNNRLFLQIGAN